MDLIAPDNLEDLPSGRRLAYDDRGDRSGTPLVLFHGTPDTRLARHPDDELLVDAGTRLIAADRPGLGSSEADPEATPESVADDHAALCDSLDLDRVHVLAWSAGSIFALAFTGTHPDRVAGVTLITPLVPADAYESPRVLEGAGDSRRMFAELAPTMDPDEAGRELAMWLVPPEIDDPTAREVLAESLAAVAHIEGAQTNLINALTESVAQGMVGLEREITAQATPLGPLLDAIDCPVTIHAAGNDTICPPAMAAWYADRLKAIRPSVVDHPDAGHAIGITAWPEILDNIT